jgi:hypothetical protein
VTVELGQRGYGPESTPEERAAIEARVSVLEDHVLLLHELPIQSAFSVNLMFDRFDALAKDWDRFSYVIDLTEARRPDAATRFALKSRVLRLSPRVLHMSAAVGGNAVMRAMARLVAHAMGLPSVSVHATRAQAIEEVRRAMGR